MEQGKTFGDLEGRGRSMGNCILQIHRGQHIKVKIPASGKRQEFIIKCPDAAPDITVVVLSAHGEIEFERSDARQKQRCTARE